ncbi:hypothetical protein [Mycolicibacterium neworleansense]|uniref:Head-to-tail stopper n=1 Tax=Mycolicibacterium neworleansense TaxID=146018 RepID=A0A0H5RVZ8_9MYCO|nr:hypothetical protein [Mycolicibacterium neworleansense]MCV7365479.1 hypothetical protein [Mycolicibacterium neworleansense]CRZ17981.1 hypothetical protein BN2156_04878 [Mycolicibacterium neworleansense]
MYRAARDRHGDAESETLVGTIDHCILQPTRTTPTSSSWAETTELVTIVWAPRDAAIKLDDRDRITVNGNTYRVVGERMHDIEHPATGHSFGYYAVQIEAVV